MNTSRTKMIVKMVVGVFILCSAVLYAESRSALLIANGAYRNFSTLENPVNEARRLRDVRPA